MEYQLQRRLAANLEIKVPHFKENAYGDFYKLA